MSGHNKWSQIKQQKGATDKKRGLLFSKLLRAIAIAAKTNPNPQLNVRLRTVIDKAKENNVPQENINRIIDRASEEKDLEEIIIEAYGLEGSAMIIEIITDNKSRTMNDLKILIAKYEGKMATPGSVLWAFSAEGGSAFGGEKIWKVKFPNQISEQARTKLQKLVEALEEYDDVQKVTTNLGA